MPVESCVKSISDHMLDFSTNSDKKKSMSRRAAVARAERSCALKEAIWRRPSGVDPPASGVTCN